MYAIRSYYEKNNDMYMAGLTKKHSPLGLIESFILRNIENELRQENGLPRITSYNVCYTKLLRFYMGCCIGRYCFSAELSEKPNKLSRQI